MPLNSGTTKDENGIFEGGEVMARGSAGKEFPMNGTVRLLKLRRKSHTT